MQSLPIDWPYASLSGAPAAAGTGSLASHPSLRARPIDASVYEKMLVGLRRELADAPPQTSFADASYALDAFVGGYRGDVIGAALALVARVAAEPRLLRMLTEGLHLGARGPEPFVSLGRNALSRVSGAGELVASRSTDLGASFTKIIDRLRLRSRLSAPDSALLLRAKDALVQKIQVETRSLMDRMQGSGSASLHSFGPGAGPGASADYEQMTKSLQEGLSYAALLHDRGLTEAATHVANTLHVLAPAVVPNNASPAQFRQLSSRTKVHAGNADGPLLHAVGVRAGSSTSDDALTACLRHGQLAPHPCTAQPDPWKFSVAVAHHNDNLATLRDGVMRSDDGPTTTNAIEASLNRPGERWVLNIDQALFTERGGMLRTDLMQVSVRHLKTQPTGRMFFDTATSGWLVGIQGTGDLGGAVVQDGWHGLSGSVLGGRRLGAGLQDTYATPQDLALLLGAEIQGNKRLGLFDLSAGGQATVPIGTTGLGRISANTGVRAGEAQGPYASIGAEGGYQWTTGPAMNFDGAPLDGFFLSPRVGLGWEFDSWSLGLEWQGNRFGTQSGLGDRDGESIGFTIRFGR